MQPVLDALTGTTRFVVATQRAETTARLAGAEARDYAAAIFAAIPPSVKFSIAALPTPTAVSTRGELEDDPEVQEGQREPPSTPLHPPSPPSPSITTP